ncbi:A24 family peptidase [bacterium]|nr:A24 family peptidase [bacterium]
MIFVFGMILGSFFNVVIVRLPLEESLGGRSKCRGCGAAIPWFYNIPLWSYLALRGKAACCGKRFSVEYFLVELTTACALAGLYLYFGWTWQLLAYGVLTCWLILISVIDLHHQIIPDELSLSGIPLGLAAAWLTQDITWLSSLMGIFVGGGLFFGVAYLYEKITGVEGLGGGDVKLLAMLGAWFGLESILIIIILSTFLGSIVGVGMMALGRANAKAAIPFGPFLAVAGWIYLFSGPRLLEYFYP